MKIDIATVLHSTTFWVIVALGVVLQVIPYGYALATDTGGAVAGFPFVFYSVGGVCGFGAGGLGLCPSSFVPLHVLFDATIVASLAAVASRARRHPQSSLSL